MNHAVLTERIYTMQNPPERQSYNMFLCMILFYSMLCYTMLYSTAGQCNEKPNKLEENPRKKQNPS